MKRLFLAAASLLAPSVAFADAFSGVAPGCQIGGCTFNAAAGSTLAITVPPGGPLLAVGGANSVMALSLSGKGPTSGVLIKDDTDTDSLAIYPGTAGNGAVLRATGPETNVSAQIQTKGTGSMVYFQTDVPSVNDGWAFGPSSTSGSGPDLFVISASATASASLQSKGFGKWYFYAVGNSANASFSIGPYVESGAYPGPILASEVAGSPLSLSGGSGNGTVVARSPLAEAASVRNTSGSAYTVAAGIGIVIFDGVTSPYALTMPAAPINGQRVEIECGAAVASLTVSANAGQTIKGAATSCATTQGHAWRWNSAASAWYMLY